MIIDKDLILLDLTGDKETIISTLANQAFEHGRLEDKQEYIEAVLKREKEYLTVLGYEVAIPHGQSDTLKDLYTIMDNKQAMQVLSNAKEAKEIIHYLKA